LALISYFLLTVFASIRHYADRGPIFIINLFLGWSLVGWMVALAWAPETTTTTAEVALHFIGRTRWRWLSISPPTPPVSVQHK
jgi:hypothetical protein